MSGPKCRQLLDGLQLFAPGDEVVQHSALGTPGNRSGVLQSNHPLAVLQRKRGIEHLGHDLEEHRANRDGHRHRESADQRQPPVLDEHADAEPGVERHRVNPLQPARVAPLFLVLLETAEPDVSLPARLLRVQHLLAPESLGLHLDVEAHLVLHVGIELTGAPQPPPRRSHSRPQPLHARISARILHWRVLLSGIGELCGHSPNLSRRVAQC